MTAPAGLHTPLADLSPGRTHSVTARPRCQRHLETPRPSPTPLPHGPVAAVPPPSRQHCSSFPPHPCGGCLALLSHDFIGGEERKEEKRQGHLPVASCVPPRGTAKEGRGTRTGPFCRRPLAPRPLRSRTYLCQHERTAVGTRLNPTLFRLRVACRQGAIATPPAPPAGIDSWRGQSGHQYPVRARTSVPLSSQNGVCSVGQY